MYDRAYLVLSRPLACCMYIGYYNCEKLSESWLLNKRQPTTKYLVTHLFLTRLLVVKRDGKLHIVVSLLSSLKWQSFLCKTGLSSWLFAICMLLLQINCKVSLGASWLLNSFFSSHLLHCKTSIYILVGLFMTS